MKLIEKANCRGKAWLGKHALTGVRRDRLAVFSMDEYNDFKDDCVAFAGFTGGTIKAVFYFRKGGLIQMNGRFAC